MYACICMSVTDNEVNAEIALGARTVTEIGERCDAGTGCGSCHDRLAELLDLAAARQAVGCCGAACGARDCSRTTDRPLPAHAGAHARAHDHARAR